MRTDPWLTEQARRRPQTVALECGGEVLTYAELHARAAAAAEELGAAGVRPGDPGPVALPPGVDFVLAFHAALLARGAVVPIDPRLTAPEREARLGVRPGDDAVMVVHTS